MSSERRCAYCGAPAGVQDRVCYACLRPLLRPEASAGEKSALDRSGTRTAVQQPVAGVAAPSGRPVTPSTTEPGALLVELRWGRYRQTVEVPKYGYTFGSTNTSDVVVPATFLCPRHARIAKEGDSWVVETLVPEASVLVRGDDVDRTVISSGQTIRLGDRIGNVVTLRVLSGAEPMVGAPVAGLRSTLPLPGAELIIGSDSKCDIRLVHALVRGRHATLRRDPSGALWLER